MGRGSILGKGGVRLPTLSNPAAAGDIRRGKQSIDQSGNVLAGTAAVKDYVNVTFENTRGTPVTLYYDGGAMSIGNGTCVVTIERDSVFVIYLGGPITVSGYNGVSILASERVIASLRAGGNGNVEIRF